MQKNIEKPANINQPYFNLKFNFQTHVHIINNKNQHTHVSFSKIKYLFYFCRLKVTGQCLFFYNNKIVFDFKPVPTKKYCYLLQFVTIRFPWVFPLSRCVEFS